MISVNIYPSTDFHLTTHKRTLYKCTINLELTMLVRFIDDKMSNVRSFYKPFYKRHLRILKEKNLNILSRIHTPIETKRGIYNTFCNSAFSQELTYQ